MCNSVDHDCDGDNRNKACLFKCYLEDQMNQNGYNNCTENYFNLLQLENTTNAHAEEPGGSNNYEYDLCCQHKETTGVNLSCIVREGTTNCLASEEKALGFNVDGFHAEEPTANTEPDSLCCNVSNPAGDFDCRRTLSGSSCLSNETGLVSLASPENSHLAEYGEYGYNICCQVDY